MTEVAVLVHCGPEPERKWHETVIERDAKRVAQLLAQDPSLIDEIDCTTGRTALHLASDCGHDEIVAQLLAAMADWPGGVDVDAIDHIGWTALHYAVIKGHHKVVEQLLAAGAVVNAVDDPGQSSDGMTALHHATASGHERVVATLLADPRIQVEARDHEGNTALHHAACCGHDKVVVALLADSRTAINATNARGCIALHLAAHHGHDKVVERLLADDRTIINARNDSDLTALYMAVKAGKDSVVTLLLAQDAIELNATILYLAVAKGNDKLVSWFLENHPESDILNGWKAFQLAVSSDRDNIVSQLLAVNPALIDGMNVWKDNVLQIAVCHRAEKLIAMFLELRPHWISSIDQSGNTLLHLAARSCPPLSPQVFTRLWQLSSESDLCAVNKHGETPFAVALIKSNDFAIDLMQGKLSIDDILAAASLAAKATPMTCICVKRASGARQFRALIEAECACLMEALNRDVLGAVYEYLGFETRGGHF